MNFYKSIFFFLSLVAVTSCSEEEPGLEQYYDNRDAGIAFLEENLKRDEVELTSSGSGLQYEVIEEGEGSTTLYYENVKFRYTVKNIDGSLVSSNVDTSEDDIEYTRPIAYREAFIEEGLKLMKVGSIYTFYVPYEIGYGVYGNENILPFSALIVELEVLDNFYASNSLREGVVTTESGLQYEIITEGSGDYATELDDATVNYHGRFLNGDVFEIGDNVTLSVADLILGFTEGIQLLQPGGKIILYIPHYLAYGIDGVENIYGETVIPSYETLIFEVEYLE